MKKIIIFICIFLIIGIFYNKYNNSESNLNKNDSTYVDTVVIDHIITNVDTLNIGLYLDDEI